MFNYNNLNVTLRVSPEISSANFYTKEESNERFVQDVPEYAEGTIYGRTHGNWVKIDGQADFIYAGFSDASTQVAILTPENLEKLSKYYFSFVDVSGEHWSKEASGIKISENSDAQGQTFWIYTQSSDVTVVLSTLDGVPVSMNQVSECLYKISGLAEGTYKFSATIRSI